MVTIPRLLIIHIEAGLPPPAPVSSHILFGFTLVGAHQLAGTHLIDFTSGGSSEVVHMIPMATYFSGANGFQA
jgi:hypothetical protein